MPTESGDDSALSIALEIMQAAVTVMESFPPGFTVEDTERPHDDESAGAAAFGADINQLLANRTVQDWLHETIDAWPPGLLSAFVSASGVIAQILAMFGAGRDQSLFGLGLMQDSKNLELMAALGHLTREIGGSRDADGPDDPTGMVKAMRNELHRRSLAATTPFARTLTTLLGPDALLWLLTPSREGIGKIQPHEFSRAGWPRLWKMDAQLAIEQELMRIAPGAQDLSRIVVALAWTTAALASFMTPTLFLAEETPYLSSQRPGHYTVSHGRGTHTLICFRPVSMARLVSILAAGLKNDLLSAADLMWAGAALARVHTVQAGTGGSPTPQVEARFDLFLSHRGRDAKRVLALAARGIAKGAAFLDCMSLPKGVINRMFIYGSLARSERVLIVETPHFNESAWCRKEAWFADAMALHGIARVERTTLNTAIARINGIPRDSAAAQTNSALEYPIAQRVLRDIDYHGRQPNLYTLNQNGHPTDVFVPLQTLLDADNRPDDEDWVKAIGTTVATMLNRVTRDAPQGEPRALWATAAQLAVAAFTLSSTTRAKMTVRAGIDDLNAAVESLVDSPLLNDSVFVAEPGEHLALIAAASAIAIAGFKLDSRYVPAVQLAIGDAARIQNGLLLLDVRRGGPVREFRLRFVATLVQRNLGSIGIIQDAGDEVHQGHVDELPLEILPCVTLYPDMEWLLSEVRRPDTMTG